MGRHSEIFVALASIALSASLEVDGSEFSRALIVAENSATEEELTANAQHHYHFHLAAGEFLGLVAEQTGVDVELVLFDSEGLELARVDSPNGIGGREPLAVIAEQEQSYRLTVRAVYGSGRYRLRLEEKRDVTARDHLREKAQRELLSAFQHMSSRSRESQHSALEALDRMFAFARDANDRHLEAVALFYRSRCLLQLNEPEAAIDGLRASFKLWQAVGDVWAQGFTAQLLAWRYDDIADQKLWFEHQYKALDCWEKAGAVDFQASTLALIGRRFLRVGQLHRAFATLDQALTLARQIGNHQVIAKSLDSIGLSYIALGEPAKAIEYYQRALQTPETGADTQALRYHVLGKLWMLQGADEKARVAFERSRDLWREVGEPIWEAVQRQRIGHIWRDRGEKRKAQEELAEALELYQASDAPEGEVRSLLDLGSLLEQSGETAAARANFERALARSRSVIYREAEADSLMALARLERPLGNLQRAEALSSAALEVVESLRTGADLDDLRASFLASRRNDYDFQIDLLMELHLQEPDGGFEARALETSERARARSLLELLAESKIDMTSQLDAALLRQEKDLERRLSRIQRQLMRARSRESSAAIASFELELKGLTDERLSLEREIRRRHPRYAAITYPQPLGLRDIQRQLDAETVLLQYALGDVSYLFAVTDRHVASFRLPPAAEITSVAKDLLDAVRRPGRRTLSRFLTAAQKLHEWLLDPAAALLESKGHLAISPDGILHALPFEALIASGPRVTTPDFARLELVLRKWSVSYLPSASVLAELESPPAAPKTFLAFADPIYPQESAGGVATADDVLVRSVFGPDESFRFRPLPETRREVASIARFQDTGNAFLFLGEEAREENVKRNARLATARRLHFATHGLISESQPRYSGLVLSLDADSEEDGILQVHEIFKLKLGAELAVLSACETGLGKEVRGEGLLGLTRAFFYAGVPSLVVSLWQVADRSTADLMIELYRQLDEEGRAKGEALRRAKLAMIEGRTFAHPYYWAPFVLQGKWR